MKKFDVVAFKDDEFTLDVRTDKANDTVWLTQKEMASLYNVTVDNISLHIKNIFKDKELDSSVSEESSVTASDGKKYITKLYNLDMIISVGYRIKSKRGILFRRWANKVLKDYLIKGYAVNEKRLIALNKTIEIQNRMLSSTLEIDNQELVQALPCSLNSLIRTVYS